MLLSLNKLLNLMYSSSLSPVNLPKIIMPKMGKIISSGQDIVKFKKEGVTRGEFEGFQIQLNSRIRRTTTVRELMDLYESSKLNEKNCITVLYHLAKLVKQNSWEQYMLRSNHEIKRTVETFLENTVGRVSEVDSRGLSNAVHALALLLVKNLNFPKLHFYIDVCQREAIKNSYREAFKLSFSVPDYRPLMITVLNRTYYSSGDLKIVDTEGSESPSLKSENTALEVPSSDTGSNLVVSASGNGSSSVNGSKGNGENPRMALLSTLKRKFLLPLLGLVVLALAIWFFIFRNERGYKPVPAQKNLSPKVASELLKTATYQGGLASYQRSQQEASDETMEVQDTLKTVISKLDDLYSKLEALQEKQETLSREVDNLKSMVYKSKPDVSSKEGGSGQSFSSSSGEPVLPQVIRNDKASESERLESFIFNLEKLENLVKSALKELEPYSLGDKANFMKAELLSKISGLKNYIRKHKKINLSRYDEIIKRDVFSLVDLIDKVEASEGKLPTELAIIRKEILKSTGISEIPVEIGKTRVNVLEHKVVRAEYNEDLPEGTIVEVLEKGYRYKGKVIRRVKVVESRRNATIVS